jgi:hypothetical protein
MIADAVKDAIPDAKVVMVDLATIRYTRAGYRYIHATPQLAQMNLLMLDAGVKPKPFRVRLPNPLQVTPSRRYDPETRAERKRKNRTYRTKKAQANSGEGAVPTVTGGRPIPMGPLAHGRGRNANWATGARREFGLRAMATRGVVGEGS